MTDKKTIEIPDISAAKSVAGVLQLVSAVGKDSSNEHQGWKFRGIDAVVNAVNPALKKVGGSIFPEVLDETIEHGVTKNGGAMVTVRLKVKYKWYGTDGGDPIEGVVASEAFDTSDKATAKAMSVAFRTFLLQTLMLPTHDTDPDEDYIERGQVTKLAGWAEQVRDAKTVAELEQIYAMHEKAGLVDAELLEALNARKAQIIAETSEA